MLGNTRLKIRLKEIGQGKMKYNDEIKKSSRTGNST